MSSTAQSWEQEIRNRQDFRLEMVRNFGFTVMDQGVALTRCPSCSNLSSINSAFPDWEWDSLQHLIAILESYLTSGDCELKCSSCHQPILLEGEGDNREYWLWHAHFLTEAKHDLQLLLMRKNGRTEWLEGMLVDERGSISTIALPQTESAFSQAAGCHFSLRQCWREFLQDKWPITHFSSLRVSEGYYLVVNPAVDTDEDVDQFKENCIKLVGQSGSGDRQFEFADLSWADSWNFEEHTYHHWLKEFETELEESNVIAGVLASVDKFYAIAHAEVTALKCRLRKENEADQITILGDDEYYLSFDHREFLVNGMIKGYDYWGALRFIEPILDSWEQAKGVGERLKSVLKGYQCLVYGGHFFQVRKPQGKRIVKEFDLLSLKDCPEEFKDESDFLSWVAPQISLNAQTLKFENQSS